jgi:hypothetical protein
VLLTGDDEGGTKASFDRRPRGRQNGFLNSASFFGKLGRDRVAVLLDGEVEKPSDIAGLLYIPIDVGGAWKQSLARVGAGRHRRRLLKDPAHLAGHSRVAGRHYDSEIARVDAP